MENIKTLFIGQKVHYFPKINSTNLLAAELLAKSKPSEGTVILTDNQQAGRGQIGSFWESEPHKNLTMSLILYPSFLSAQQQFILSQALALAIRAVVSDFVTDRVKVKWPNDIYVRDQKIAGLLLQSALSGTKVQSTIVGVGLNVNQVSFQSDAPNPISLKIITNRNFDLKKLLGMVCQKIEHYYLAVRTGKKALIEQEYLKHLYAYREKRFFKTAKGVIFEGQITGLTTLGKLMVTYENGHTAFGMKEVQLLPKGSI